MKDPFGAIPRDTFKDLLEHWEDNDSQNVITGEEEIEDLYSYYWIISLTKGNCRVLSNETPLPCLEILYTDTSSSSLITAKTALKFM